MDQYKSALDASQAAACLAAANNMQAGSIVQSIYPASHYHTNVMAYIIVRRESEGRSYVIVRLYRSKARADSDCALLNEFAGAGRFEILEQAWIE